MSTRRRDNSSTKSSTSNTSRPSGLATPVQYVKGVGPALARILATRGISTVGDLLFFLPRTYQDRTRVTEIGDLATGTHATVSGTITDARIVPGFKPRLQVTIASEQGERLTLVWFNARRGQEREFRVGRTLTASGTPRDYGARLSLTHPEISFDVAATQGSPAASKDTGRIVPVYPELEGISSRIWRSVLWNALETFGRTVPENLPQALLLQHRLMDRARAIRELHFPTGDLTEFLARRSPAQIRMIFEEFYFFERALIRSRATRGAKPSVCVEPSLASSELEQLLATLPFALTGDQKRALDSVVLTLTGGEALNVLLQGDVGSGKTIVALLAAALVIKSGAQVALLAPTEILAGQHLKSVKRFFGDSLPVVYLVGSLKSERAGVLARLKEPEPCLAIGTHALLEPDVSFYRLGFAIIDEQHRFGVDQRRALRAKGQNPHLLVMSATPIPRTLALSVYGDLESLIIKEKPAGRKPIVTRIVRAPELPRLWSFLATELAKGAQGYLIAPFVEDSEAEGFESIKSATQSLEDARTHLPGVRVEILHGRMVPEEKEKTLAEFAAGKIGLLVCTTVVEVGIDVPNATIMVIQNADRFGLSTLHQLRGRVGRGSEESKCFLVATHARLGEAAEFRLGALESTNDGFVIAEQDLKLRGPGELVGTAQAGGLDFKVANLLEDAEWLELARTAALASESHSARVPAPRVTEDTVSLAAARHQS